MDVAHAWLADEVVELLMVGSVGLYELIESLQQSEYWSNPGEARRVSKDVVTDLVNRGAATICLLRWPGMTLSTAPIDCHS